MAGEAERREEHVLGRLQQRRHHPVPRPSVRVPRRERASSIASTGVSTQDARQVPQAERGEHAGDEQPDDQRRQRRQPCRPPTCRSRPRAGPSPRYPRARRGRAARGVPVENRTARARPDREQQQERSRAPPTAAGRRPAAAARRRESPADSRTRGPHHLARRARQRTAICAAPARSWPPRSRAATHPPSPARRTWPRTYRSAASRPRSARRWHAPRGQAGAARYPRVEHELASMAQPAMRPFAWPANHWLSSGPRPCRPRS